MKWKYFFNPFLKFSEKSLLIVGLLSMVAGSFCGKYCSVTYDGVFSVHSARRTFLESLQENTANVLVVFLLLLILGKIINSKTRMIDILNISLIYRIPLYISGFFVNVPILNRVAEKIEASKDNLQNLKFDPLELIMISGISSFLILILVYAIVLLINGFRTATNLKKWQYYVAFAVVLIIGEVLSQTVIHNI